jgi:hypothetical protein
MKTISRVYDSYAQARAAVSAVEAAGVPTSEVSLVANKYVSADYVDVDDVSKSAVGLGIGGVVGGGAGLLAGLGMLAIPGLGPVVAAGWLAAAAVVAVAGATAGGLVGALVDAGESNDHAHVYSESVRRGGTLVTARVQDQDGTRVMAIMDRFKPIDPVQRGADYRKGGLEDLRRQGGGLSTQRERDRTHASRRRLGFSGPRGLAKRAGGKATSRPSSAYATRSTSIGDKDDWNLAGWCRRLQAAFTRTAVTTSGRRGGRRGSVQLIGLWCRGLFLCGRARERNRDGRLSARRARGCNAIPRPWLG